jgi:hypothetical protein
MLSAMRHGPVRTLLVLSLAGLLSAPAAAQQENENWLLFQGRVVDADGRPVAGVTLSRSWTFENGKAIPYKEILESKRVEGRVEITKSQDLVSDADGYFAGGIECWQKKHALLALTDDLARAGLVEVTKGGQNDRLRVTLAPTVRVHGSFTCEDLDGKLAWTNVYMTLQPGNHRLAQCHSHASVFDMRLSPGRYQLDAYGVDTKDLYRAVKLEAETPDLDLGALDLPAEYFALMKGKPLPEWHVTAARGVPLEKSRIADFRGKWLLIEFWGFW